MRGQAPRIAGLCVGVLLSLVACSERQQVDQDAMIMAAKELDQKFFDAFNRGDVEGVMATYWQHPDLKLYPLMSMELDGPEGLRAGLKDLFASNPGARAQLTEAHYEVAGDLVVSWGKLTYTIPAPEVEPQVLEVRYTDLRARRDGQWVYIHDHVSVPMTVPSGE